MLAASEFFDPSQPVVFPSNYPDEFFYAIADSGIVADPGLRRHRARQGLRPAGPGGRVRQRRPGSR